MAIARLTDRTAVLETLAEYDRLGREAFLRPRGFGHATKYMLRYEGRCYDSKAIAGVAYGRQFPEEGTLKKLHGGGRTTASLRRLGFKIVGVEDCTASNPVAEATFSPGRIYRRRLLHESYGGQRQGGISTPAEHPIILLFTGKSGHQYGYQDTWQDDDHFDYVGEGQRGDMKMNKGNAAILNHAANGKALHLFEDVGHGNAKYLSEMACIDYYTRSLVDADGRSRQG